MFLYAFISGASISFPHLFLHSLNEVHRSSTIGHALIHPIFIHRIFLFLGLADFPSGEPVHVVAPLGATFLRQRAAHLRVDPSGPRGASFVLLTKGCSLKCSGDWPWRLTCDLTQLENRVFCANWSVFKTF